MGTYDATELSMPVRSLQRERPGGSGLAPLNDGCRLGASPYRSVGNAGISGRGRRSVCGDTRR